MVCWSKKKNEFNGEGILFKNSLGEALISGTSLDDEGPINNKIIKSISNGFEIRRNNTVYIKTIRKYFFTIST